MDDPATEILEGVDHNNASPTDGGETAAADAVSMVLDNDDLLLEIFFRLGLPTSVVRAILVCKRWFFLAADPFFLHWFRRIHPPRLLGCYVATTPATSILPLRPRFVPMPPEEPDHKELAAAVRMAERYSGFDAYDEDLTCVYDLQNDTMIGTGFYGKNRSAVEVHWPLSPHRGVVALPVTPYDQLDGTVGTAAHFLQKVDDGANTLAYVWLSMGFIIKGEGEFSMKYKAHIYVLQEHNSHWRFHSSAAAVLPSRRPASHPLLVGSKIYLEHSTSIAVLDVKTSSFSTIPLPEGMERYEYENMMLAPAYDSGIFLIHLDEDLELGIWLLHVGMPEWLLVDVFSLPEMFDTLGMTGWTSDGEPATLFRTNQMGDLVEFVFLKLGQCALCLDTRRRVLRKVYEVTQQDETLDRLHPIMMTWPPKFPALKADHLPRKCQLKNKDVI